MPPLSDGKHGAAAKRGKTVATAKAWFTRATQMLFTLPTQTQGQHIRMRSPSPFYLAVMAWNRWNMCYMYLPCVCTFVVCVNQGLARENIPYCNTLNTMRGKKSVDQLKN